MRTRTSARLAIDAAALLVMVALYLASPQAHAASVCVDIAVPRDAVAAHGGKWIQVTPEQWQFLRGIYVLNPNTAAGLPFGDRAVLAQVGGDSGGLVFWIDGARACQPMAIPGDLVELMNDVGAGVVKREPSE
jgi:hypothetical protein